MFFLEVESLSMLPDVLLEAQEKHQEIEYAIHQLETTPDDQELINGLFRAVHTIKGNAAYCQLTPVVDVTHELESVLQRVRVLELSYTNSFGEIVLLCVDRVLVMMQELSCNHKLELADCNILKNELKKLVTVTSANLNAEIIKIMANIAGHYVPTKENDTTKPTITTESANNTTTTPDNSFATISESSADEIQVEAPLSLYEDLQFFKELAEKLEVRHEAWSQRTEFLFPLVMNLNDISGNRVSCNQLEAALYLHDVGMAFLSDTLLKKQGRYTDEERAYLCSHPILSFGLVDRFDAWREAAQMVYHHHERIDGTGYPNGLKGSEICEGAKILAICDAFFSMTHGRSDRPTRKSILRAIVEINACSGQQFSPEWVVWFNSVIKIQSRAGDLI